MDWTPLDTWIVITAALAAMACSVPGLLLVLTRQSLQGAAISHGVLPGLAVAFLFAGSANWGWLLVGAISAGILVAMLTHAIHRFGGVENGAALGVVFCVMFASGLLLIRVASIGTSLDPDVVLYGSLELSVLSATSIPPATQMAGFSLALNLILLGLFYKELLLVCFDPAMARSLGYPVFFIRQGLVVITAVTTVLAFESVGSILVLAMLVIPGATAALLSRRLPVILGLTLAIAAGSALLGHLMAVVAFPWLCSFIWTDGVIESTSSAASMAVCSGLLLMLTIGTVALSRWVLAVWVEHGDLAPDPMAPALTDVLPVVYGPEDRGRAPGVRRPVA